MSRRLILLLIFTVLPITQAADAIASARTLGKAFAKVSRDVKPAVVYIRTEILVSDSRAYTTHDPLEHFSDEFARRFFNIRRPKRQRYIEGMGSGFIISANGYILTNTHVIEGARNIMVKLIDGREYKASVIGSDQKSDVALIKINRSGLPFLEFGDSQNLEVGEWVLAIGSPFGLSHTVTSGIVSAKGRSSIGILDYEDFIQTDAAINPGNSGGPLINLDGQVVGLNTAIFSKSGGYMGIGFSIPSNAVKRIYNQLRKQGKFVPGYMGVVVRDLNKRERYQLPPPLKGGVYITNVPLKSPARQAGLQGGDIITAIDGKDVKNAISFNNLLGIAATGEELTVEFVRRGVKMQRKLTLSPSVQTADYNIANTGLWVREMLPQELSRLSNPDLQGVVVTKVSPGSPAENMELTPGTIIIKVDGVKTHSVYSLANTLTPGLRKGQLQLLLMQNGRLKRIILRNTSQY